MCVLRLWIFLSYKDDEVFLFLWKDELLLDEENGANRQLGVVFLYQLIRKEIRFRYLEQDCTQSFAELLMRWFHLKHCRWGRETISEGEQEADPSKELVQLINVLTHPNRGWPAVPKDEDTARMLNRGLDMSAASRTSMGNGPMAAWGGGTIGPRTYFGGGGKLAEVTQMVKLFFQFLDQEVKQAVESPDHRALLDHKQAEMRHISTGMNLNNKGEMTVPLREAAPIVPVDSLPVRVANFRCDHRSLPAAFSDEEVALFSGAPLLVQEIQTLVEKETVKEVVSATLPFDVDRNPESRTPIAVDMLNRLKKDTRGYAESQKGRTLSVVKGLATNDINDFGDAKKTKLTNAKMVLDIISAKLVSLRDADRAKVSQKLRLVVESCEKVDDRDPNPIESRLRFELARLADQRPTLRLAHITSMIMSSTSESDMLRVNPYIHPTTMQEVVDSVVEVLLRTSRVRHASRAIDQIRKIKERLQKVKDLLEKSKTATFSSTTTTDEKMGSMLAYLHIQARSLASLLTTKRQFIGKNSSFDPRFLVFEYVFDIVLRPRQVEIVRSFRESVLSNQSRVQQMIMGAGKTTVVGPLLTLMLADGETLVTQVMPSALLQQTKEILRSRFASAIMPKRVYTLEFERSVEDSADFAKNLFGKLKEASDSGSVVCASPEAIKSLALKFVEHLHVVEEFDVSLLQPGNSVRQNEMALDMRERMISKSDMADALVKILDLWGKGILIMDEVDVLLHPLRSELNFPIGHKYPIDLSGYRWDLPIHLCDAIFFAETRQLSEPVAELYADSFGVLGIDYVSVLENIVRGVENGYARSSIQKSPHLVLLDTKFYHKEIKPHVAKWALGWLQHHFVGRCKLVNDAKGIEVLLSYLQGDALDEGVDPVASRESFAKILEPNMSGEAMKLVMWKGNSNYIFERR